MGNWWPTRGSCRTPRVVDGDDLAVAVAFEDVPQERQRRRAEDERENRGDRVEDGESVRGQVVGVAARHAFVTQPVLDQERAVETDERGPEMPLAQALVHQPSGHLREPEVDTCVGGEHDRPEQHVVEMRDHEVAVGYSEIECS